MKLLSLRRDRAGCLVLAAALVVLAPAWGQVGRPPTMPGNVGGGALGGSNIGGSARPGAGMPAMPGMAPMNPPAGLGMPRGGAGMVGGPGMPQGPKGMPEKTWHCPRCNREVGRGPFAPTFVSCCGQTYANGHSLGTQNPASGFGPGPGAAVVVPGGTSGGGQMGVMLALGAGIVLVGLVILGVIAFLVLQSGKSARPAPRRRRRYDD
ncbi:MAG: hypothetical protein U0840_30750 [Gemmataceae bacterium]